MQNIQYRVFASNHEFPEGKMYYPETMTVEVDKDRGFLLNQFGNLVHVYYKGSVSSTDANLVWARIGFNINAIMLAVGNRKDIEDKQMWVDDMVEIYGGVNNGKKGVIVFEEETASYIIKGHFLHQHLDQYDNIRYKVIGNIHENKELLENE
jgi:hypothetical protein